jgi:hypothetical protein
VIKSGNMLYGTVIGSDDKLGILNEAKNMVIETEADEVLNFDENNPFGDP